MLVEFVCYKVVCASKFLFNVIVLAEKFAVQYVIPVTVSGIYFASVYIKNKILQKFYSIVHRKLDIVIDFVTKYLTDRVFKRWLMRSGKLIKLQEIKIFRIISSLIDY